MALKRPFMVRLTEDEAKLLASYADQTGRTQSDVVRELIRSLQPPSPPRRTIRKRRTTT